GKGMDEILKSMDVHSTETSQADYKLSSLASIRLAVRVPFMLKMAGEELSNFVSKGYRDL
ncbi:MAG: hypothetical protein NT001_04845, partial [Candidatus Woesearchaeota archaeon]|nr:hypothetical protein [Candidatus Woesearchaeota archaeon]